MDRGIQNTDRPVGGALGNYSWDDLRIFLVVAEAGSLKAAARQLYCSHNTVRAHVARLEDRARAPLLIRTPSGIVLTELGIKLRLIAQEMKAASSGALRPSSPNTTDARGKIHIAVTEGLGIFWLVPRFAQFHRDNPSVLVTLDCNMSQNDLLEHETDLAVQLVKPADDRLVCTRIGALHLMPFASRDYVNRKGAPESIEQARAHEWVVQIADQVRSELFTAFFGDEEPSDAIALKTNNSAAHYWAIAKGIGIGMLPTYARAITANVIPIDMGLQFRRDIWLTYHPEAKRSKDCAAAIEWIKAAFDRQTYPWFADNFIHPDAFDRDFSGTNVVRLFAGFMDVAN